MSGPVSTAKAALRGLRSAWRGGLCNLYLAAIALLLATWVVPPVSVAGRVQDTLFVIDISESMNVQDVDDPRPRTSRIELARASVRMAMETMDCGSRASIALFAGEETVVLFEPLEICSHYPAIEQVVSGLTSHMRWIGDSHVETGVRSAMEEAAARQLNLVFVTDGDEMPHRSQPRLQELDRLRGKTQGALLVVGGESPLPVPHLNMADRVVGHWTAEEAVVQGFHPNVLALVKSLAPGERAPAGALDTVREHLSAARPAYVRAAARAAGLQFAHLQRAQDAAAVVRHPALSRDAPAPSDVRWVLVCMALALALPAWWMQGRAN